MSDAEAHKRTYRVFHENGLITLTEHELVNEYMHLREQYEGVETRKGGAMKHLLRKLRGFWRKHDRSTPENPRRDGSYGWPK
jgi:hypothetical protein